MTTLALGRLRRLGLLLLLLAPTPAVTSIGGGCTNDTSCLVAGGTAWLCAPVSSGGAPCQINGHQPPLPPYRPWPTSSCACQNPDCSAPAPAPPPGTNGFGCRSGRCVGVLASGTQNSTQTCEWATGCIGLKDNEWLAATFEYTLSGTALTCHKTGSVLKKSQLPSGELSRSEKISVMPGTKIQLTAAPELPTDQYWVVSCANNSICARPPAAAVAAPAPPSYLMIGDSISLGYLQGVKTALDGKLAVTHSTGNAGNINKIAHYLNCFLGQIPAGPSVVTLNAGIHDLARGQEWISMPLYTTLLTNVTRRLVATGTKLLLVTTTPVPTNATDSLQPSCPEGILERDVIAYNTAMTEIAKTEGAGLIDLHGAVVRACGAGYSSCVLQAPNNPHFEAAGWALLAKEVADGVGEGVAVY